MGSGVNPPSAILTTAAAGVFNQAEGLAAHLGLSPYHWVVPHPRLRLTPNLWRLQMKLFAKRRLPIMPWDEESTKLVISCGKHAVLPAILAKRSAAKPLLLHIQNPRYSSSAFDLIISPAHDGLKGGNVITSHGSLHRISRELLRREGAKWRLEFASLPPPLTVVLIGGARRFSTPSSSFAYRWAAELEGWRKRVGGTLLLLPSGRTPPKFLAKMLSRLGTGGWKILAPTAAGNPYMGAVAAAAAIVVSGDSVNMVSEAVAANKPVYVKLPPNLKSSRLLNFHRRLRELKFTMPFAGDSTLDPKAFTDEDGNEMPALAREVRARLKGIL